MPTDAHNDWLRIEERNDGPPGFPFAVVLRDEVATWSKTRDNAIVLCHALTAAYETEVALEARGLLEDDTIPEELI